MTQRFAEGQEFEEFRLLQALDEKGDTWLALDQAQNQAVCLRRLPTLLSVTEQTFLRDSIARHRGLIHPHVLRTFDLLRWNHVDFLVCEYIESARVFSGTTPFVEAWPILLQLIDVLEYAQGFDLVHGNIQTSNLLVDNQQQLHLAGFGLQWSQPSATVNSMAGALPSRVLVDRQPSISADSVGLGTLLLRSLTEQVWHQGSDIDPDDTLPAEVKALLQNLLEPERTELPTRFLITRNILQAHYDRLRAGPAQELVREKSSNHKTKPDSIASQPKPATLDRSTELPPQREQHLAPFQRPTVSTFTAIMLTLLLALISVGFFTLLPTPDFDSVNPDSTNPSTREPTASRESAKNPIQNGGLPASSMSPFELSRLQALADNLLRQQISLEDQGVQVWAPAAYDQVMADGLAADEHLQQRRYDRAHAQYQAALEATRALENRIPAIIENQETIAAEAFLQGNAELALSALKTLIAIRPDNAGYQAELIRAENFDQVLTWLRQAQAAENLQAWPKALAWYQQALALDPEASSAQAGIVRITETLKQMHFSSALSLAFDLLEQKDLAGARQAFVEAQSILPDAKAPKDGLIQVGLYEDRQKISTLRQQAEEAVRAEDWPLAIRLLDQVLDLAPGLTSASLSLEQAHQRLALDQTLNGFLRAPERMRLDAELTAARQALISAAQLSQRGPGLEQQISRLSLLISQARIPLPVILVSDNQTDITVYQVGHLGTLSRQELALVPGTYIIVGRRQGYRDIRYELHLNGDVKGVTVNLICDEEL